MWITWQAARWLALGCGAVALATFRVRSRVVVVLRGVVRETAIVAGLYALWQWVFSITVTKTAGAERRARDLYHLERAFGLPSERAVQQLTMKSHWLTSSLNTYYAYVHVPALAIMVLWLFFRHRDRYPPVRNVLALTTGACLAIQSIPVAPPRFLPGLGFVDTALIYHQSVYGAGGSGISNQLAAMPSVHVAWSTLVAGVVIVVLRSRWRWLIVAHPLITMWAVVATGNHWWADGIVSILLIILSCGVVAGIDRLRLRISARRSTDAPPASDQDRSPVKTLL